MVFTQPMDVLDVCMLKSSDPDLLKEQRVEELSYQSHFFVSPHHTLQTSKLSLSTKNITAATQLLFSDPLRPFPAYHLSLTFLSLPLSLHYLC